MADFDQHFRSQYGEDRILFDLFQGKQTGTCVEIGGLDGVTYSNSYFFEQIGWRCLVVEPIPKLCERIRAARTCEVVEVAVSSHPGEATFYMADGQTLALSSLDKAKLPMGLIEQYGGEIKEIKVQLKTLDQVLSEAGVEQIDFISIDVEGHEMEVLQGFSIQKYRPAVLIIEENSGMIDNTITNHMAKFGYVRFKRTGGVFTSNANDWYAHHLDHKFVNPKEVWTLKLQRGSALAKHALRVLFRPLLRWSILQPLKQMLRRG